MKVIVQYSGGKDSQASLLWAIDKYGVNNVVAVFCDTGWEHPLTYAHINATSAELGVELIILHSEKYSGMVDLAVNKKRFPSTKARFCTSELKTKPMIDYVLSKSESLLIIQGIRADESESRAKMSNECRFFKYYYMPYGTDKDGKPKFHTYRKKEVLEWCKNYDDSIMRPFFYKTGQQVIDYIKSHRQEPNPLYKLGAHRVGCFPCIMSNKRELRAMIELTPEWIEKVREAERIVNSSFFPPDYIPKRFCSKKDKKGTPYPCVDDVVKYLSDDAPGLFNKDEETVYPSCMSFYGLCE